MMFITLVGYVKSLTNLILLEIYKSFVEPKRLKYVFRFMNLDYSYIKTFNLKISNLISH